MGDDETIQEVDLGTGASMKVDWKDFGHDQTVKITIDGYWFRANNLCFVVKAIKKLRRELRRRQAAASYLSRPSAWD